MRKRLLLVAPFAVAALSLSAVPAFASSSPGTPRGASAASCTPASNQAALLARLRNDQAALDAARARLQDAQAELDAVAQAVQEGHQPWRLEDVRSKQAEVAGLEAAVQNDQQALQHPCQPTTGHTSPAPKPAGTSSPTSGGRDTSEAPGLPQTGAAG